MSGMKRTRTPCRASPAATPAASASSTASVGSAPTMNDALRNASV
jgi:hypothetical protein